MTEPSEYALVKSPMGYGYFVLRRANAEVVGWVGKNDDGLWDASLPPASRGDEWNVIAMKLKTRRDALNEVLAQIDGGEG